MQYDEGHLDERFGYSRDYADHVQLTESPEKTPFFGLTYSPEIGRESPQFRNPESESSFHQEEVPVEFAFYTGSFGGVQVKRQSNEQQIGKCSVRLRR